MRYGLDDDTDVTDAVDLRTKRVGPDLRVSAPVSPEPASCRAFHFMSHLLSGGEPIVSWAAANYNMS